MLCKMARVVRQGKKRALQAVEIGRQSGIGIREQLPVSRCPCAYLCAFPSLRGETWGTRQQMRKSEESVANISFISYTSFGRSSLLEDSYGCVHA